MANIKNLERIRQIAFNLPKLEEARKLLSQDESAVAVHKLGDILPNGEQEKLKSAFLPNEVKMNILNVLNLEINREKEELKGL